MPISQMSSYQCIEAFEANMPAGTLNHFFPIMLQGGIKDIEGLLDSIYPSEAIFQDFHSASIFANVFSFFFIY